MENCDTLSGETNCLGWCNKKFISPDKLTIRFCDRCRKQKEKNIASASKTELLAMQTTVDKSLEEYFKE